MADENKNKIIININQKEKSVTFNHGLNKELRIETLISKHKEGIYKIILTDLKVI